MQSSNFVDIYYKTLVHSLLFSISIENDLDIYFKDLKREDYFNIIHYFQTYFSDDNPNLIINFEIKNNMYKIIEYLTECFKDESYDDKVLINDSVNCIKRYLNQDFIDNTNDYLREQILLRDYGVKKSNFNITWQKLKFVPVEAIEYFKNEYFESISKDVVLFIYLLDDDNNFYNNDYNDILMSKNFYRTLNYLILTKKEIFQNDNYLKKILYIIEQNIKVLSKLSDEDIQSDIDDEFLEIHNISNKLLKKTYYNKLKGMSNYAYK